MRYRSDRNNEFSVQENSEMANVRTIDSSV